MNQDIRKHRFLEAFGLLVIVLALIRCALPGIDTVSSKGTEAAEPVE